MLFNILAAAREDVWSPVARIACLWLLRPWLPSMSAWFERNEQEPRKGSLRMAVFRSICVPLG